MDSKGSDIGIWAEYWYSVVGVNVIPADTKNKRTFIKWSEWQLKPIPEELHQQWKNTGAYNNGIAVIVGRVWRGDNAGKYLIFIDCDNQKAIDEFCTRSNVEVSLETIAQQFIVEQHQDSKNKCHIFFYSEIPFIKKSSDIAAIGYSNTTDIPAFEVKGQGTHGIAYVTPSLHKSGHSYEIIGTTEPVTLNSRQAEEMMQHLDLVCRKYGLSYLANVDENGRSLTPIPELFKKDFIIPEGHNRHLALLRVMESLIERNASILSLEQIKQLAHEWNQEHCYPPKGQKEFEENWVEAMKFIAREREKKILSGEENDARMKEFKGTANTIKLDKELEDELYQEEKEEERVGDKEKEEKTTKTTIITNKKEEEDIKKKYAIELVQQFMKYHEENLRPITWKNVLEWQPFSSDGHEFNRQDWELLLKKSGDQLVDIFSEGGLRNIHDHPITKIKDLSTKLANKLVATTGQVIGVSELKPDWSCVNHECTNCGFIQASTNTKDPTQPPKKCIKCREKEFVITFEGVDASQTKDMQGIMLQEGPLSLSCVISGTEQDMWNVNPGQKAYALGVLKFEAFYNKQTRKPDFKKYLKLLTIQPLTNKDVIVTEKDIARFKEMVKDPLFYQCLIESFAPHITGLEEQKEVCIFVLASQGLPRPNNGLLCGPPARAKSELVKYTVKVSHNGGYKAFTNVSVAGLTSASVVDPNTGIRHNYPGEFTTRSLVGLTELQAIKKKEELKVSLNSALEDKEVASAKAEGSYNLKANCAVIIDTNNYAAGWEYDMRLAYNLQFMEPNYGAFISRMDLVSISPKVTDKKIYRQIAYSNFDSYSKKTDPIDRYVEDWEDPVTKQPRFGFNTLRKYFAYITQQVPLPEVNQELREYFADAYQEANDNDTESGSVDGRYPRIHIMQTRIRARMLLKTEADKEDMEEARRIVNKSKNVTTKTEQEGEFDANAEFGVPAKRVIRAQVSDETHFMQAIEHVMSQPTFNNEPRTYFTVGDILLYFMQNKIGGWSQDKVEKKIMSWYNVNRLKEVDAPGSRRYALV